MKPKREQRACVNEWNRNAEARARLRGQRMVTARLGPAAYARLSDLCAAHDCTIRDVIEGFLFGNLDVAHTRAMTEHGLSYEEAAAFLGKSK